MDWITNIKTFIDVIDFKSFSKAAQKRFTSPATLSRRIQWLEDQVGVKLIARTTRKLQLTEEGEYFYERSKIILENLKVISSDLKQEAESGTLKITMAASFAEHSTFIICIKKFAERYPGIKFNLDFNNDKQDLLANDFDIALRGSAYDVSGYESTPLLKLNVGIYAAPEYLNKFGKPQHIDELKNHNCLINEYLGYATWEFKNGVAQKVQGNIKANSTSALVNFAIQGLGIVRTLENYTTTALIKHQLEPVLIDEWPRPFEVHLVYRSGESTPKRISTFVAFLKNEFSNFIT